MDYPGIMKKIASEQGFLFGTVFVLSPPIANFVKQKYNTIADLEKFIAPPARFPFGGMPKMKPKPGAKPGTPAPKMGPMSNRPMIPVIVTGGTNNNYWSAGGMRYSRSIKIDDWR